MTPQERWGLPDWKWGEYPENLTDAQWRWEFLRRHPDYRKEWDRGQDSVMEQGGVLTALTKDPDIARLHFGVSVIYDPRQRFDAWNASQLFTIAHGTARFPNFIGPLELVPVFFRTGAQLKDEIDRCEQVNKAYKAKGIMDYRFSLAKPLEPQLTKARDHLLKLQSEMHGKKKNTERPRRTHWPLYLQVLDAHDCGAGHTKVGKALCPKDEVDATRWARNQHRHAKRLLLNFPV